MSAWDVGIPSSRPTRAINAFTAISLFSIRCVCRKYFASPRPNARVNVAFSPAFTAALAAIDRPAVGNANSHPAKVEAIFMPAANPPTPVSTAIQSFLAACSSSALPACLAKMTVIPIQVGRITTVSAPGPIAPPTTPTAPSPNVQLSIVSSMFCGIGKLFE